MAVGLYMEKKMSATVKGMSTVKIPNPAIKDDGRVRKGLTTPLFPQVHSKPENVADGGKVRLGFTSPAFPRARAR